MRLLPFDYAIRNLGRAPSRLVGIIAGNMIVVLLIITAAAFVEGMHQSLSLQHETDNVLLLGVGSEESIERSEIPAATASLLSASVPGIRTELGVPFISPEILSALIILEAPGSNRELRAVVRGVTSAALLVHPRTEIVEGRAPEAGRDEIMVGRLAAEKMGLPAEALQLGKALYFDGRPWEIVGRFHAPGTVLEAEIWMPLTDLQVATKRDTISCVVVTLDTAEFPDVDAFTKMRVDLELAAMREADYYASLLRFYRPVQIMVWVTACLAATAGLLGGLNTLYAAFAARVREIGMLQSLGFSRIAIAWSLMQESLLASAGAVLLASLIARAALNGAAVRFSMGVFELNITGPVLAAGASAGMLMGLVGAIPPAWRCLRLSIPESLKTA